MDGGQRPGDGGHVVGQPRHAAPDFLDDQGSGGQCLRRFEDGVQGRRMASDGSPLETGGFMQDRLVGRQTDLTPPRNPGDQPPVAKAEMAVGDSTPLHHRDLLGGEAFKNRQAGNGLGDGFG